MIKWKLSLLIADLILISIILVALLHAIIAGSLQTVISNTLKQQQKLQIDYSDLEVNLLSRTLSLKNVFIRSKTEKGSDFKAEVVSLEELDIFSLIFKKEFRAGMLYTIGSAINIRTSKLPDEKDTVQTATLLYDVISPKFSLLLIDRIEIKNSEFNYFKVNRDTAFLSSKKSNIYFDDFLVDSTTAFISKKLFDAKALNIYLTDITHILDDSLYTLKIPNFYLSYTDNKIIFDSLQLTPNYDKYNFSRKKNKQSDRFTIFSKRIEIDNINVKSLVESFRVDSSEINVDSIVIKIYRDKYVKKIKKNMLFVQELIESSSFPVRIKELQVVNSYIEYEELLPPAKKAGKIFFTDLNIYAENFSNVSSDSADTLHIQARGNLFGESFLNTSLTIPYSENLIAIEGSLEKTSMIKMNSMIAGSMDAKITEGIIDSLKFKLLADERIIKGKIKMAYHDFKVALMDEDRKTSGLGPKIKSMIANNFVLIGSNPLPGEKLRTEAIYFNYQEDKFIIGNTWKAILSGINKSVGVKGKN